MGYAGNIAPAIVRRRPQAAFGKMPRDERVDRPPSAGHPQGQVEPGVRLELQTPPDRLLGQLQGQRIVGLQTLRGNRTIHSPPPARPQDRKGARRLCALNNRNREAPSLAYSLNPAVEFPVKVSRA